MGRVRPKLTHPAAQPRSPDAAPTSIGQLALSWLANHQARDGIKLILFAGLGSAFSNVHVAAVGPYRLRLPVSLLMLSPLISGVGAARLITRAYDLSLPDPPIARLTRLGVALAALGLAMASSLPGLLHQDASSLIPAFRNVLFNWALCVCTLRYTRQLIWLPVAVVLALTIMFSADPAAERWLFQFDPHTDRLSAAIVIGLVSVALVAIAAPYASRVPPMKRQS